MFRNLLFEDILNAKVRFYDIFYSIVFNGWYLFNMNHLNSKNNYIFTY